MRLAVFSSHGTRRAWGPCVMEEMEARLFASTTTLMSSHPVASLVGINAPAAARKAGIDLSGVASWNSASGNRQHGGVLIDRRHVLFATHYALGEGVTLRWPSGDTATIVATRDLGRDITVATLDHSLPKRNRPLPIVHYSGKGWVLDQNGRLRSTRISGSSVLSWSTLLHDGDSGQPVVAVSSTGRTGLVALAHFADGGTALWTLRQQIAAAIG